MGDPGVDPRPGLGHRVEGGDPGDAALQKHSYARRSEAGGARVEGAATLQPSPPGHGLRGNPEDSECRREWR